MSNSQTATNTAIHHQSNLPLSENEKAEVQNMAAIRSLLFGKENAQINTKIKELESRFEKVAKNHSQRIEALEEPAGVSEADNTIEELQKKVARLEQQLLQGTRLLRDEISFSDDKSQVLMFEKIRELSDATLRGFELLQREVRSEMALLEQKTSKNSEVGEVLMKLGRQLQGDPHHERSNSDDSSEC